MGFFNQQQPVQQQAGPMNIIQQFNQFRQNFRGDPQQVLQQLMSSGKVSKQQYEQAANAARQLMKMLGK